MRKVLICALCVAQYAVTSAQPRPWTLRECADYAVSHNISIKQQENQRLRQEVQLNTARNARLPDLSGSVGQNFSFGRGLTAENTYTNTNTSSTSFSVGASVPLFTGFQIPNTIKMNQLNLEAATADLDKARNDIRMQVAQAYVQTLYDLEIRDVANRQVGIDSMQVDRMRAMVDNGKASVAELSQQQATCAQSRLTATQAENNYQLSILSLTQLLELPSPEGFSVVVPEVETLTAGVLPSPDLIYAEALGIKPEIRSDQLKVQAAEYNIKVAQASYYPQLSFSAGLGSNYYKTSGFKSENFGKQLENNFSQYLGLSLSVPIFNRFQTRNSVRSARLDREQQLLQLDQTKKSLYKEIQQVYYNGVAAKSKYESAAQAVKSSADAFSLMKGKYENGKATVTEFNESKNNYLKAESDCVQARYEFLYQSTLLNFYRGQELVF